MYDVVVVGGGAVGAFAALRAAELSAKTALVDPRGVFGGASSRSAGCFTVQLDTPVDVKLVAQSIELVTKYTRKAWKRTGFLQIGRESDIADTLESLRTVGIGYKMLSAEEILERWQLFRIGQGLVGLYTEPDLSTEPRILGEELRSALSRASVTLLENAEVVDIRAIDGEVKELRLSTGETLRGSSYVFAAGAWTGRLLERLGLRIEQFLITCYAYKFDVGAELQIPSFSNEALHTYWRPWGRYLVGGRYDGTFSKEPDLSNALPPSSSVRGAYRMIKHTLSIETEPILVEHLRGPCSFYPDGLPVFGLLPPHSNLVIVDGLGGYGLMRGPAMGARAAELLLLGKTDEELLRFSCERFADITKYMRGRGA
jgi:glycine/D-amino acid oxidase-like deaminating enzyme